MGIKKIKIDKGNSGELKISSKTLIKNIKEYLNKYAEKKLEEKEKIIQKLKNDFCSEKRIEVSYKCENTYPSKKNEELYLLLFSFITLNEKIIKKKENRRNTRSFNDSRNRIFKFSFKCNVNKRIKRYK